MEERKRLFKIRKIDGFGLLVLLVAVAVVISLSFMVQISHADDLANLAMMKNYNWLSWIRMRYLTWSGRVSNEAVGFFALQAGPLFFHLTNPIFVLLAGYSCARLISDRPSFRMIAISLMSFGLMNAHTQTSSIYWISGSYGYIMPAAFGFLALIPFADCFFRGRTRVRPILFVVSAIAALIATLGNEPLSLVVTVFALLCMAYQLLKRRRVSVLLWILTAICICGTFVILHSPGSAARWHVELRWFPGFENLTIGGHAKISMQFIFDSLVNDDVLLLMVAAAIPFLHADRYHGVYRVIFFLYTAMYTILVSVRIMTRSKQNGIYNFHQLFDFSYYRSNYYAALTLTHLFPYIIWSVFAVCLILLVAHISDHPWFDVFCFMAVGATLLLITFSPTIYASGKRVLFIGSLILSFMIARFASNSAVMRNNLLFAALGMLSLINVSSFAMLWLTRGFFVMQ